VAAQDNCDFMLLQEMITGIPGTVGYGEAESRPCACVVDDQRAAFACLAWFKPGVKLL